MMKDRGKRGELCHHKDRVNYRGFQVGEKVVGDGSQKQR